MKFCLINNLFFPFDRGGAERIVELSATGLLAGQQSVIVITAEQTDGQKDLEETNGLKIYRIKPKNIYTSSQSMAKPGWKKLVWHFLDLFNFYAAEKVAAILKKEKPDFVITHNLKGFSYQIPKAIHRLGISHLHLLHDYQLIDPHGSLYRRGHNLARLPFCLKVYAAVCRRLFANVSLVISPSRFVLDKHLEYHFFQKAKQRVLPNPVILPTLAARRYFAPKIRFLYLGQIEEHKGVKFLIQSFNKCQDDDLELAVVGDGSLLNELRQSTNDKRIKFFGRLEKDKLPEIFGQTDVTVVPSLWWDNSPTVIYESYAQKVPVLVSDQGGAKELVQSGKTGYIFKSGDQGDFIAALHKIAQNRANLAEFGAYGYEFIKQYQLANYVNKLLELCQELRK